MGENLTNLSGKVGRQEVKAFIQDGEFIFPDEFQPRVFWPGDELPVGIVVMARDGSTMTVKYPGIHVQASQPDPLVEVPLPNFDRTVRLAWGRRWARAEMQL